MASTHNLHTISIAEQAIWLLSATSVLVAAALVYTFGRYFIDRKRLRQFPAPSIAAYTPLWAALQTFRHVRYIKVKEAHASLGPVVRLGPNHLSFAVPEALRDIYGHGAPLCKDEFYSNLAGGNPSMADAIDKTVHSQRRSLMAHFFSPKEVYKVESKVRLLTSKLLKALKLKSQGKKVSEHDRHEVIQGSFNARPWFDMFAYDVITTIVWSLPYGLLDTGNDSCKARMDKGVDVDVPAMSTFHDGMPYLIALAQLPEFWYKVGLKVWRYTYAAKCGRGFTGMVRYLLEERMAHPPPDPDLFSSIPLVPSDTRPQPMTAEQILAECTVLLNAGHDTTQTTINNFIYLQACNPKIQQKLYGELRRHLPGPNLVHSYTDIQKIAYLRACIDETLRVLPATRYGLPRRTPKSGAVIAGYEVGPDVTVSVPLDVVHLDDSLFESAADFIPERWLASASKIETGDATSASSAERFFAEISLDQQKIFASQSQNLKNFVQPFQLGPRACIGRNIAFMELSICMAALILGFEWELVPEKHPNGLEFIERLTCNPKELFVKARFREGAVINETI